MRSILIIITGLVYTLNVHGTVQYPDLLLIDSDTVYIDFYPLDDYLAKRRIDIKDYGVWGCWSSACWRGYQATWELIDNKLYLVAINSCCDWDSFHDFRDSKKQLMIENGIPDSIINKINPPQGICSRNELERRLNRIILGTSLESFRSDIIKYSDITRPQADIKSVFGGDYKGGRVFAEWYSADIIEPSRDFIYSTDSLSYKPSYELILEFEDGVLKDSTIYKNSFIDIDANFTRVFGDNYLFVVPNVLTIPDDQLENDLENKLLLTDPNNVYKVESYSVMHNRWLKREQQMQILDSTLEYFIADLNESIEFKDKVFSDTRYGTTSWIDGYDSVNNTNLRFITAINRCNQVIIIYSVQDKQNELFRQEANYITESIMIGKNCN